MLRLVLRLLGLLPGLWSTLLRVCVLLLRHCLAFRLFRLALFLRLPVNAGARSKK